MAKKQNYKESRAGIGGRKQKYGEKTVQFGRRVPVSKEPLIAKTVDAMLKKWEVKR